MRAGESVKLGGAVEEDARMLERFRLLVDTVVKSAGRWLARWLVLLAFGSVGVGGVIACLCQIHR